MRGELRSVFSMALPFVTFDSLLGFVPDQIRTVSGEAAAS